MFVAVMVVCTALVLFTMLKTHYLCRCILLSVFQGLTALFAVNFVGEFISVHLPVNWFSLSVGAVGGLPGIIFLLICDIMCAI